MKIILSNIKETSINKQKSTAKPSTLEVQQTNLGSIAQIPFYGIGTFFNKLVLKKNKYIDFDSPQKVLDDLANKEYGGYALTDKGFVPITPREFQEMRPEVSTEFIIKNGTASQRIKSWSTEKGTREEVFHYRSGVSPTSLLTYIERGFTKVTAVVDDGLQVLTLPNLAEPEKTKVINKFKNTSFIRQQEENTLYMMPNEIPDYWYELTEKMIKKTRVPGFSIQKITDNSQ